MVVSLAATWRVDHWRMHAGEPVAGCDLGREQGPDRAVWKEELTSFADRCCVQCKGSNPSRAQGDGAL